MPLIRFIPVYDSKVWGGRSLEKIGRILPAETPIGESREIFDFPKSSSKIASGKFAGKTLKNVLSKHSAEIMGKRWNPQRPFPILVKLLDCKQRLSLQVHPSEKSAKKFNVNKKSEAWYFLKTSPISEYITGVKPRKSKKQLLNGIKKYTLDSYLISHESKAGDFIFIRSGILHAIGGGNVILEIQENSTCTYRIYDWGRIGLNGKPRKLHIDEALESIDLKPGHQPQPLHENDDTIRNLATAKEFKIMRYKLKKGESFSFPANKQPRLVSVVKGALSTNEGEHVAAIETVLVPFSDSVTFSAEKDSIAIVTENFA